MAELPIQHSSHLFTVRIWQEDVGEGKHEWRGIVKYVISKEERSFRDCESVGMLMLSLLPQSTANTELPLINHRKR